MIALATAAGQCIAKAPQIPPPKPIIEVRFDWMAFCPLNVSLSSSTEIMVEKTSCVPLKISFSRSSTSAMTRFLCSIVNTPKRHLPLIEL
ncbi:MAG: hypothetical protein ACD_75C00012G0010 [uncultured bacterium]|nr:MAG: hypothetical protein ACD_75C00012G0010 [uncultured bacterium]